MITMTTDVAGIHGTRMQVESVLPMVGSPSYMRPWKQRLVVVTPVVFAGRARTGVLLTDNSTGVSEVECRPT